MKKIFFGIIAFFGFFSASFAADFSRFEFFREVHISGIFTPKIVRVEIPEEIFGKTILTDEKGNPIFHRIFSERENLPTPAVFVESASSAFQSEKSAIADGNFKTSFAFSPNDFEKSVVFDFPEKTEISRIFVNLDDGVIPPRTITISADFGDGKFQKIIDRKYFSAATKIPKISPKKIKIEFDSPHFLRIKEISFGLQSAVKPKNFAVFFAENDKKYRLFFGAHFGAKTPKTKFQNLKIDEKTPTFVFGEKRKNQNFDADFDDDGIPDDADLCPRDPDPKNTDADQNGRGDACEDPDADGFPSAKDNCPFAYNPMQKDADADGIGDACDAAESRFSENHREILWLAMAGIVAILGFLMFRVSRKK